MRRVKLIVIVDAEVDNDTTTQDLADLYSQVLQTVHENIVHDLVLYEEDKKIDTFNSLLDDIKLEFQYGDYRNWKV